MNQPKAFSLASIVTVMVLSVSALPALATPALTLSDTVGQPLGNPPFTLGFAFSTNSAITITDLGLFDSDQDGLLDDHDIGVYDSSGTLLASATLLSGTSGVLVNQFRYVSISSLNLLAGSTYRIGAVFTTGNDLLMFPGFVSGFATDPAVNFLSNGFASGGTLNDPASSVGADPAYFGPNFLFNAVPEPGTLALLGLGLAGLATLRRLKD